MPGEDGTKTSYTIVPALLEIEANIGNITNLANAVQMHLPGTYSVHFRSSADLSTEIDRLPIFLQSIKILIMSFKYTRSEFNIIDERYAKIFITFNLNVRSI